MSFRVGQEVVCIGKAWRFIWGETEPQIGKTYTITAIHKYGKNVGLSFEEIVNPPHEYSDEYGECSFLAQCFRPIVKTDISIFEKMLAPSPKQTVSA